MCVGVYVLALTAACRLVVATCNMHQAYRHVRHNQHLRFVGNAVRKSVSRTHGWRPAARALISSVLSIRRRSRHRHVWNAWLINTATYRPHCTCWQTVLHQRERVLLIIIISMFSMLWNRPHFHARQSSCVSSIKG